MSVAARVGLVVLVTLVSTSCRGAGDAPMRLVLTDSGCTYEGEETPTTGSFTVDLENRSSLFGAFALARLAGDATAGDVRAYIDEEQRRWEDGKGLLGPPAFYEQVVRAGVDPGASSRLPADVPPGTYVLTCFVDDLPTWRGYLAGQLDVAGGG